MSIPFGVVALRAAYSSEGEEWLEALKVYLHENYLFFREYLGRRLPQCPVAKLGSDLSSVGGHLCLSVSVLTSLSNESSTKPAYGSIRA